MVSGPRHPARDDVGVGSGGGWNWFGCVAGRFDVVFSEKSHRHAGMDSGIPQGGDYQCRKWTIQFSQSAISILWRYHEIVCHYSWVLIGSVRYQQRGSAASFVKLRGIFSS